jgi:small subunit ribosomal protein S15Ae
MFWQRLSRASTTLRREANTRSSSGCVVKSLFGSSMVKHGYTSEFEVIDDHRAGKIVVNLTGRLNKRGVISPRFDVRFKDLEK